jgi:hypothetical protein
VLIEQRNTVAYGGFKKSISGYTRNRVQNPTVKIIELVTGISSIKLRILLYRSVRRFILDDIQFTDT